MIVYARADVVPDDCDYITVGKHYRVVGLLTRLSFILTDDKGGQDVYLWSGTFFKFTRVEYPVRDPEVVEALIKTLQWYAEPVLAYALTQSKEPRSAVHEDGGKRARVALALLEPAITTGGSN